MTWNSYAFMGLGIARSWGLSSDDLDATIKTMDTPTRQVALLAGILNQLDIMHRHTLEMEEKQEKSDPSEGIRFAMMQITGDRTIEQADLSGLSIRARKAINRGRIKFLSEITHDRLINQNNCGEKTIEELLKFKAKYIG